VAGALPAELALIPQLGVTGCGLVAAGGNFAAAAIAWRLSRDAPRAAPAAEARLAGGGRLLGCAFLAGGALLALEVVGFRFLLLFLDGTTLVFAVMLAVVLAGIGLGGLLGARAAKGGWLTAVMARRAAAAASIAVVVGYAAFGAVVHALAQHVELRAVLLAAFVLGPTALLSGFLFTALGAQLRARMQDAGAATGVFTLANTLGAMLGSLAAAFVLLPLAGIEKSFYGLALAYGALALLIPAASGAGWRRLRPALAAAAVLAFFPFGAMTGTYYRHVEQRFNASLVAAREGVEQTAFYLRHDFLDEPLYYRLATNAYSMSSTAVGVQRYMTLFAWLPGSLHPGIEKALLLCFGVGTTAKALTALPAVKAIDVVDTSRDILEMSDVVFPDPATHPLRDPRVTTHVEDARFFLQLTRERYDLITGEPPPPKMAGVASLYTREYFDLVKSRLNPGGIATYWLPAYLLLQHETLAVVRAFCDAFEDCSLWSGFNLDWILVGSNGGLAPVSRDRFARLFAGPTGDELRRLGIDSPEQLAGQFMADAATLKAMTADVPPLDDDHPRRVRSALYAEDETPVYKTLMDATQGRERLAASAWASILPVDGREGFRRRAILDAAFNPGMRGKDYDFWGDMTYLLRRTDLVELPRWLLGSGAKAAAIAARKGPADPLAAEHLAIDALAHRRTPEMPERDRFLSLPPWGRTVALFHHCVYGKPAEVRTMLGWIGERGDAFAAWAKANCGAGS